MTEEEVKLNYITPAIVNAGWAKKQIRMEYSINAGKIVVRGNVAKRLPKKKLTMSFSIERTFHLPLSRQRTTITILETECSKLRNTLIN